LIDGSLIKMSRSPCGALLLVKAIHAKLEGTEEEQREGRCRYNRDEEAESTPDMDDVPELRRGVLRAPRRSSYDKRSPL
jgi:hypothetical protein